MLKHPLVRLLLILAGVVLLVSGVAADPTHFIETILSIPEVIVNTVVKMAVTVFIVMVFAEMLSRYYTGKSLRTHRNDNDPLFEYLLVAAFVVVCGLALTAL